MISFPLWKHLYIPPATTMDSSGEVKPNPPVAATAAEKPKSETAPTTHEVKRPKKHSKRTAEKEKTDAPRDKSSKTRSTKSRTAKSAQKTNRQPVQPQSHKSDELTDEEADQWANDEIERENVAKKRADSNAAKNKTEQAQRLQLHNDRKADRLRRELTRAVLESEQADRETDHQLLAADISSREILKVVRQKQRTFQLCYDAMHTYDRLPKASVQTSWKIMPNGTVKMTSNVTGGNLTREAKACIGRALQSMKFPRQRAPAQLVNLQVKLKTYP